MVCTVTLEELPKEYFSISSSRTTNGGKLSIKYVDRSDKQGHNRSQGDIKHVKYIMENITKNSSTIDGISNRMVIIMRENSVC